MKTGGWIWAVLRNALGARLGKSRRGVVSRAEAGLLVNMAVLGFFDFQSEASDLEVAGLAFVRRELRCATTFSVVFMCLN